MRSALLIIGLLLISAPMASAYTISPLVVDPNGSLTPGTPVIVTFIISKPQSGQNDFPGATDLELSTDLVEPAWSVPVISEGVTRPLPARQQATVRLSDWEPGVFQNVVWEQVMVTLSGHAPGVEQVTNLTVVRITQLDSGNNPIAGSNRTATCLVINPCDCIPLDRARLADLQTFRSHIDEKTAMEIDTSAAEVKYQVAKENIAAAGTLPSGQHATALDKLGVAGNAIDDGERLLDKAWAEKKIADAQVPMKQADEIIGWYKANQSTAHSKELPALITQRDQAAAAIVAANDEMAAGNYAQARSKAAEAYQKGDGAYKEAAASQRNVTCCFRPFDDPSVKYGIIGIGTCIVLLSAGIFLWKKRSK